MGGIRTKVPFAPLRDYLDLRYDNHYRNGLRPHLSDVRVAEICGVDRIQALRWRTSGEMTLRAADRVAVHLGIHVTEVWSTFYDDLGVA